MAGAAEAAKEEAAAQVNLLTQQLATAQQRLAEAEKVRERLVCGVDTRAVGCLCHGVRGMQVAWWWRYSCFVHHSTAHCTHWAWAVLRLVWPLLGPGLLHPGRWDCCWGSWEGVDVVTGVGPLND